MLPINLGDSKGKRVVDRSVAVRSGAFIRFRLIPEHAEAEALDWLNALL
jgi:hypothetical protein